MSHTTTLIDQFKARRNIESDYAAAKLLGVTQQALSNYRAGLSHADDRIAIILADELGVDRLKTIARINGDRAKKPEDRAFWKRIATAAAILLAVYTATSGGRAVAAEPLNSVLHIPDRVCIVHALGSRGRGWHVS